MFIEFTDKENGGPIWVNLEAVVAFNADGLGGTALFVSREKESVLISVEEEPYKVWSRIRAEENRE